MPAIGKDDKVVTDFGENPGLFHATSLASMGRIRFHPLTNRLRPLQNTSMNDGKHAWALDWVECCFLTTYCPIPDVSPVY